MTTLRKSALLALAAGALTVGAFAPAAYAQPPANDWRAERIEGGDARAFRPGEVHGPGMRGGILGLLLGAPDAEAIDVAAIRLTHRLELTDDQIAALDALKSATLEAQQELADAREAIAPLAGEVSAQVIAARYAGLVAMTTARAEALEAVQPALVTFVESLDEDQITRLAPQHPATPDAE